MCAPEIGKIQYDPTITDRVVMKMRELFMSSSMKMYAKKSAAGFIVTISFILCVLLMGLNITHSPLWGDEIVEYFFSQKPILSGALFKAVRGTYQPPLFNVFMHFWLMINTSTLWFRCFNLVIGVLSILFIYNSVIYLHGKWYMGCAAILIHSSLYQWVYCVQEASEYSLMIFFCILAIYCFIRYNEEKRTIYSYLLVLFCVCAVYSQYGAFFIISPVLTIHFIDAIIQREKKPIKDICIIYTGAFVFAAIPLFVYAKNQLLIQNALGISNVSYSANHIVSDFFLTPGGLIAYFLNIESGVLFNACILFGIIFQISCLVILLKEEKNNARWKLVLIFCISYLLHYILVKGHVYAINSSGSNAGFFVRYSYFYFSEIVLILYVCFDYWVERKCKTKIKVPIVCVASCFLLACIIHSIVRISANWEKSNGKYISEVYCESIKLDSPEKTYLIEPATWEYKYYVDHEWDESNGGSVVRISSRVIPDDAPNDFFIWYSSWGENTYNNLIDDARNKGYKINVLVEDRLGAITRCKKGQGY